MYVNGGVQQVVWHLGGGAAFSYERGTPVQCCAVDLHHDSFDCFRVDCAQPLLLGYNHFETLAPRRRMG